MPCPAQADAHIPKSITIAFEHISGRQHPEALLHMMGGRLSEVTPVELGHKSYILTLAGGSAVHIQSAYLRSLTVPVGLRRRTGGRFFRAAAENLRCAGRLG